MTILISLAILASILLVLVVLAQNSKGGGLSSQFGGSGASNLIGVKKTGDLLERLTWGFAIAIIVLSLATNLVDPRSGTTDEIMDRVKESQAEPGLKKDATLPAPTSTPADSTK